MQVLLTSCMAMHSSSMSRLARVTSALRAAAHRHNFNTGEAVD